MDADDIAENEDELPLNDCNRADADYEAAQILRNISSDDSQSVDPGYDPSVSGVTGAGEAAASENIAGTPPIRKRGRPKGSKNKAEDPEEWEPKEVSVTITGGSFDIDPALLDRMYLFLTGACMAGMFALERGGTVSHLHLQVSDLGTL